MNNSVLPESSDIYLECNGKKVAVVQSYHTLAKKTERTVEAFGERESVATIVGQPSYIIELTRLYVTDDAVSDGIRFHDLTDFSLVVVKPGHRVVYTDCNWSQISENGDVGDLVAEKIVLHAAHRVETTA